jgi:hypothetical protein
VRSFTCVKQCPVLQKEIKYLGHNVDKQGICPDPKKVEAVQTWPVPKNVHDVRVTVHRLDGIETHEMAGYNDSTLR